MLLPPPPFDAIVLSDAEVSENPAARISLRAGAAVVFLLPRAGRYHSMMHKRDPLPDPDDGEFWAHYLESCRRLGVEAVERERAQAP